MTDPWPDDQRVYALAAQCLMNVRCQQRGRRVSLVEDRDRIERAMRLLRWLGTGAQFVPLQ